MARSRFLFKQQSSFLRPLRRSAAGWCGCLPSGLTGASVLAFGIWRSATPESGSPYWALAVVMLTAVFASAIVKLCVLALRAALLRALPEETNRNFSADNNPTQGVNSHVS